MYCGNLPSTAMPLEKCYTYTNPFVQRIARSCEVDHVYPIGWDEGQTSVR